MATVNSLWSGASLHTRRPAELGRINILRFTFASPNLSLKELGVSRSQGIASLLDNRSVRIVW